MANWYLNNKAFLWAASDSLLAMTEAWEWMRGVITYKGNTEKEVGIVQSQVPSSLICQDQSGSYDSKGHLRAFPPELSLETMHCNGFKCQVVTTSAAVTRLIYENFKRIAQLLADTIPPDPLASDPVHHSCPAWGGSYTIWGR